MQMGANSLRIVLAALQKLQWIQAALLDIPFDALNFRKDAGFMSFVKATKRTMAKDNITCANPPDHVSCLVQQYHDAGVRLRNCKDRQGNVFKLRMTRDDRLKVSLKGGSCRKSWIVSLRTM
jgi:hypothetical protein